MFVCMCVEAVRDSLDDMAFDLSTEGKLGKEKMKKEFKVDGEARTENRHMLMGYSQGTWGRVQCSGHGGVCIPSPELIQQE